MEKTILIEEYVELDAVNKCTASLRVEIEQAESNARPFMVRLGHGDEYWMTENGINHLIKTLQTAKKCRNISLP